MTEQRPHAPVRPPAQPTAGRRSEDELTRRQLDAVQAWHCARRAAEQVDQPGTSSREARMDLARRLEVLRAEHTAIVERTEQQLRTSVHQLARHMPQRAVIAHRNAWFCSKVSTELVAHGIEVVGVVDNGAQGVGVLVAEQPDLVLVEDTLPMVSGEEVVREARRFAPHTLVVVQVAYEDRIGSMLEAGARAAYTRRVPPAEMAREVVALLQGGRSDTRLVDA
jgi:CheY-like chemotaxis protein